jgi:hypothetical protein
MYDSGQLHELTRSLGRDKHGDLADDVRRALARLGEIHKDRNWLYAVPRVRWPRLHRYGGEWLEIMSGIRFFVDNKRQAGSGDYIFQIRKRAVREVMRTWEGLPEEFVGAYKLAEALRWQYMLEPESIFG